MEIEDNNGGNGEKHCLSLLYLGQRKEDFQQLKFKPTTWIQFVPFK